MASRRSTNLLTSLVFVLPLLVFYGIGVLFTSTMNGADLLTRTLLRWLDLRGYLAVQAVIAAGVVGVAIYLRRSQRFELRRILPVLLESGIYALTIGTLIVFVMIDLLGIDPRLAATAPADKAGVFERLVMSAGAGVHEELVFRLLLMSGLIVLFDRVLKLRRWLAVVLAIVVSSILFSAAHHIGPLGDPLRMGVFVYRTLAGTVFALLYRYRSFAIAVYTHALYDVYVLLLAPA